MDMRSVSRAYVRALARVCAPLEIKQRITDDKFVIRGTRYWVEVDCDIFDITYYI